MSNARQRNKPAPKQTNRRESKQRVTSKPSKLSHKLAKAYDEAGGEIVIKA